MSLTIALDGMGGDHGPPVIVPAALHVLTEQDDLKLILVSDRQILEPALHHCGGRVHDRRGIHHASQTVVMDELPSGALRSKKDSSMPGKVFSTNRAVAI